MPFGVFGGGQLGTPAQRVSSPKTLPLNAYYPSVAVNFRIRFDEAFSINPSVIKGEPIPANQTTVGPLINQQTAFTTAQGTTTIPQPLILSGQTDDDLSHVMARVPKHASIEMPGYRAAGKFSLTYEYKDLPIDPRLLRNCAVDIFVGAVQASNFANVMTGREKSTALSTVALDESNLYMVGMVDSWSVKHTENSSEISMDGRDLQGLLLDTKMNAKAFTGLKLDQPIHKVVKQILGLHPQAAGIPIEVIPNQWNEHGNEPVSSINAGGVFSGFTANSFDNLKLPSPADKDGLTRVRLGADGKKPGMQASGDATQLSFWDMITKYCFLVGAIPHFVGFNLRLSPSRSLYDQQQRNGKDPSTPTPFANGVARDVPDGGPNAPSSRQISIRELIYGQDILSLSFERRYGGVKSPTIRCVSVDTSSGKRGAGRLLIGEYPNVNPKNKKKSKSLEKVKTTDVGPSGSSAMNNVLIIPQPGISSVKVLQQIAEAIYHEVGHHEMGGNCSTKNLASFGGGNRDPDLLHLLPGDPIKIRVDARALSRHDTVPLVSEASQQAQMSFQEQVNYIARRVGDVNLARVIVATAKNAISQLQDIFRVKNVKIDFNHDSGIAINFDFENYIEVRNVVDESIGPNILHKVKKGASPVSKAPINRAPQQRGHH